MIKRFHVKIEVEQGPDGFFMAEAELFAIQTLSVPDELTLMHKTEANTSYVQERAVSYALAELSAFAGQKMRLP